MLDQAFVVEETSDEVRAALRTIGWRAASACPG